MRLNLERALAAKRESSRVAFRRSFDSLDIDIAAMANSGGGVILFDGAPPIDFAHVSSIFGDVQLMNASRDGQPVTALLIGEAASPLVSDGVIYVRRGAKSVPATSEDVAAIIDRRAKNLRKTWLTAVRRAVTAEPGGETPVRIVSDPRAPAYRPFDYDKTHPYRQKELLATLRERLPDRPLNQFDLQAVRWAHKTDERADFAHKSMFGTRQYSEKYVEWLVEQARRDERFFEDARQKYLKR